MFVQYLRHFIKHTRPTEKDPVLLIVDNHSSRMSLKAVELCCKHQVVMLLLPPHSMHKMQPLDITFYSPFKTYYSQAYENWMPNHPGHAISEAQVPGLVRFAYEKSATQLKFMETGIFPYNPDIFCGFDFAPSLIIDRPLDVVASTSQDPR